MSSFNSFVSESGSTYRFPEPGVLNAKLIGNFKSKLFEGDDAGLKGRVMRAVTECFADREDLAAGTIKLALGRVLKQFSESLPSNAQDELYTDLIKAAIHKPAASRTWIVSRPFLETQKTSGLVAQPKASGFSFLSAATSPVDVLYSPEQAFPGKNSRIFSTQTPIDQVSTFDKIVSAKFLKGIDEEWASSCSSDLSTPTSQTSDSSQKFNSPSSSVSSSPRSNESGNSTPIPESLSKRIRLTLSPLIIPPKTLSLTGGSPAAGGSLSGSIASSPPKRSFDSRSPSPSGSSSRGSIFSAASSPVSVVNSPVSAASSPEQSFRGNNSSAQTPTDQVSTFNFIKTNSPNSSVSSSPRSNESGSSTTVFQVERKYTHLVNEKEAVSGSSATNKFSFFGLRFFKFAFLFLVGFFVALAVIFGRANRNKDLI